MKSNLIKDTATRDAVLELEKFKDKVERIPQLSQTATIQQIVDVLNKITSNLKRN